MLSVANEKEAKVSKAARLRLRDGILENMLVGISQSPASSLMVLRGGGALHFVYSSPRYSADLDFAAPELDSNRQKIVDMGLGLKFAVNDVPIYPELRANNENNIRIAYAVTPTKKSTPEADLRFEYVKTKIREVADVSGKLEVVKDLPGKNRQSSGKYAPLLVETPDQIYADKIFANLNRMLTRGSIKGTDLFDLEWITANFEDGVASESMVEERARCRDHQGWSKEILEKVLRYIHTKAHHVGFQRQFRRSMDPDFYQSTTFDSAFFEKAAQHYERIRKAF